MDTCRKKKERNYNMAFLLKHLYQYTYNYNMAFLLTHLYQYTYTLCFYFKNTSIVITAVINVFNLLTIAFQPDLYLYHQTCL